MLHRHTITSASEAALLATVGDDAAYIFATAQRLSSTSNPRIKLLRKLQAKRARDKSGLMILEGHRLLTDALDAGYSADFVLLSEEALHAPEGARLARSLREVLRAEQLAIAPQSLIAELSDTQTPQGVVGMLQQPRLALPESPSFVLVLDRISDPGNLGTLLRSAAGAGVESALLLSGCTDPWGLKALRAGMGAQLRLPLVEVRGYAEAAGMLRRWGCHGVAADARGETDYWAVDWRQPSALVVGSEAHGLAEEVLSDVDTQLCRIPLANGVESLNAAIAGSVMMYEVGRQRRQLR
uniref:RNA 2-O ribose methyltransferase substrate binding domain-containing protein n=1 Tax=Coccolithus braarudii TaxID=221442 RepID=A0A7S0LQQ5_9EUKA